MRRFDFVIEGVIRDFREVKLKWGNIVLLFPAGGYSTCLPTASCTACTSFVVTYADDGKGGVSYFWPSIIKILINQVFIDYSTSIQ